MQTELRPRATNADNSGLGSLGGRGFTIGLVPGVNDGDAEEVPEFAPTRHELIELFRYWAKLAQEIRAFEKELDGSGSWEWRTREFGMRRLERIEALIGEEESARCWHEVSEKLKAEDGDHERAPTD